jgi:hypothetical protein
MYVGARRGRTEREQCEDEQSFAFHETLPSGSFGVGYEERP